MRKKRIGKKEEGRVLSRWVDGCMSLVGSE